MLSLSRIDFKRLAVSCLALALTASPALGQHVYVQAGSVIDVVSGRVLKDHCIQIRNGRIKAVGRCRTPPKGAEVVDWSRYTVLPGLIDLHTHLADVDQSADVGAPLKISLSETVSSGEGHALKTLRAGFTTVRDVGAYRGLTDIILRDKINEGEVPGPRMFVVGAYITIPGGGGELNGVMTNDEIPEDFRMGIVRTRKDVIDRTSMLFENGADFIKLIATGAVLAIGTEPGTQELTEVQMRAAVKVATAHNSYATAHAHGAAGIKAAIRAGVRSIEHASLIDDEALQLAKDRGVWLVMDVYNGDYIDEVGTKEGWPAEYLRKNHETTEAQREGFRKAVKMGVKLAYGTDSGVYPHGLNARQFAYMVRYGMTPMAAIQSATVRAAELMGKEKDVGSIAPGRFADLIAVQGDPLKDIRMLESVAKVMKDGVLVP